MYFMCGKMAAGKSTYARELAQTKNAVLLFQDEFLDTLYAGEIRPGGFQWSSTFLATLEFSVNGFERSLKAPTSNMNCISSTCRMISVNAN